MNDEEKCENCGCEIHPCMPCEEVVMLNGNHTDYEYSQLLEDILKNHWRVWSASQVRCLHECLPHPDDEESVVQGHRP
jgi:23S rRNA U2552 (ribose-2'-O)-methylase RlmE/FtsJ